MPELMTAASLYQFGRCYERERICNMLRARMDQLPPDCTAWQEANNLYTILNTDGTEPNPA